jgi:hypothetical protein
VLAPTRELADQVAASFEKYAKGQKLSWAALIGGVSMEEQVKKLDRGRRRADRHARPPARPLRARQGAAHRRPDPRRRRGRPHARHGLHPGHRGHLQEDAAVKQTLFFSATMPPEITRLTKQFLKDPTRIEATRPATTAETIKQHIARIPSSDPKAKRTALRELMSRAGREERHRLLQPQDRGRRRGQVAEDARLRRRADPRRPGPVDAHPHAGELQEGRPCTFLVASDVAARGLDIPA